MSRQKKQVSLTDQIEWTLSFYKYILPFQVSRNWQKVRHCRLPFLSPPSRCICFFPSGDSTCRQVDCEGNAFFDENERLRSQKSATHLYFQVVYHRLAEFYRDELSYGVVEADNILLDRKEGGIVLQVFDEITQPFLYLGRAPQYISQQH